MPIATFYLPCFHALPDFDFGVQPWRVLSLLPGGSMQDSVTLEDGNKTRS
jgi:hypothetical protein